MFCRSCGKPIPDESQFCNVCGVPQGSSPYCSEDCGESMRGRESEPEEEIFTIRPTLFFIVLGYGAAILVSLGATVLIAHLKLPLGVALGLAALLIAFPIVSHLRRQAENYTLTTHRIEIRTGLLSKTTRSIPLARIQDVTTTRSIGERLIGIGDVEIDSAAEAGKCFLRNVPHPVRHVEIILGQMKSAQP